MIKLFYFNSCIGISAPYSTVTIALIKDSFADRKWNKKYKCWEIPANKNNYIVARNVFPTAIFDGSITRWFSELSNQENKSVAKSSELLDKCKEYQFKIKPYNHQLNGFKWAISRKSLSGGIFFECGLGKTKTILDTLSFLYSSNIIKKVLIVIPLSVAATWRDEIPKHTQFSEKDCVFLTGMSSAEKIKSLNGTAKPIYIINYDSVAIIYDTLKQKGFDMLICDESTYIKSYKSHRTKALSELSDSIKSKWVLTGTPFGQRVMDVYSQVKLIAPEEFHESYFAFRNKYCVLGGFKNKEIVGYNNLDALNSRISKHCIIARKDECLDLPPKIYETRTCEMSPDQDKIYNDLIEHLMTILKSGDTIQTPDILAQMTKLAQITGGFISTDGKVIRLPNPKLMLLKDTLEEVSGKVVVFCRFIEDVENICNNLPKDSYVSFTGGLNEKEREQAISEFVGQDKIQYFVSTSAGGYGLNLQVANTVIFYSHEWSIEKRQQQEDRCHRSGQNKAVTIIDLVSERLGNKKKTTIDNYMLKCTKEKIDFTKDLTLSIKELANEASVQSV